MKVTVTRNLPGCPQALLSRAFHDVVVLDRPRPLPADELRKAVESTDVLICTLNDKITAELLDHAKALKLLITFSVGVDHIDLAAVKQRGLPLVHTPQVLTESTADLAWALILGCARRIKPALRFIEEGQFSGFDPGLFLGVELSGKVLGIVGMGKIGMAVAKRGASFGMRTIYHGTKQKISQDIATEAPLEHVLASADVVSLHCPLSEKTRHLISRRELGIMKPQAVLVNTARGPIVDEAALIPHLRTHSEFYAGLDVFEKEPHITEALRHLPNALCVPHIGSATTTAREAMGKVCLDEAVRFAKGEELRYDYYREHP